MKGINEKAEFGFLSQLESKKWIEIGTHYKEPKLPVWVVYLNRTYGVVAGWHQDIIT